MTPHPPLTQHYSGDQAKPVFVDRLFDAGAQHYDAVVGWGMLHSSSATCVSRVTHVM